VPPAESEDQVSKVAEWREMASAWTYDVGDYRNALDEACDRIEALEARLEKAESNAEVLRKLLDDVERRAEKREAQLEKADARTAVLRRELEFYAEPKNWKDELEIWGMGQCESRVYPAPAKLDAGERARLVLLLPPDEAAEALLRELEAARRVCEAVDCGDPGVQRLFRSGTAHVGSRRRRIRVRIP
jgi:DNA repair exonuclease SbcCD ATPase subunit